METPIENRPIPGLTAKALAWLLGCTITVVSTTIGSYFSLQRRLDRIENNQSATTTDISTIKINGTARDLELKVVNDKVENLRVENAKIKATLKIE